MQHQFPVQCRGRLGLLHQGHVGIDTLPLDVMGEAHHCGLGDRVMQHQRAFHLGGAHAVPGDVDHVIHASGDPVVTVFVAARAVAGEILAGEHLEIGVDEALMVAINGAHLAGPGTLDAQGAGNGPVQFMALVVHQARLHAKTGPGSGTGFQCRGARVRGDEDAAGLGLPPGVGDGAAAVADYVVVPFPGFRVDRFADAAEHAQAAAIVLFHELIALSHQRPQRRGRGIEDVDLVLVHHLPEAAGVGISGHALEHQGDGAVTERAVNDVGMSRYPAHIGGAPIDLAVLVVEYIFVGQGRIQQVAAGGVQHPFGLAGRAGGIEDEQRVFGVHDLGRAVVRGLFYLLVIPDIASFSPGHRRAGALDHYHAVYIRALSQGLVGVGLERRGAAATHGLVCGDDHPAVGIQDAVFERFRGEAAEHNRVNGANAGAGQHSHGRLGDHRHVDGDAIALAHAPGLEDIGAAAYLPVQFPVGDLPVYGRIIAFPDNGDLIAAGWQVPVQAVVSNVQLRAAEPVDVHLVVIPVLHLVPLARPAYEFFRLFGPESIRVIDRSRVHGGILPFIDVGGAGKRRRRGIDFRCRHGFLFRVECMSIGRIL